MTAIDQQASAAVAEKRLDGLRCCVLGATGFLGRNLTRALCDRGATVRGLARDVVTGPPAEPRMEIVAGDFACEDTLAAAVRGHDVVFHLVGTSLPAASNRDPAGDLVASVAPTIRLLDICRCNGVSKVVFASSGGTVYGIPNRVPIPETAPTDPITAYGVAKLAIEKYLRLYHHLYGLDYQILRISNPYGRYQRFDRGQGLVATAIHRLLSRYPVEVWGDGSAVRDYIHVDDVAAAFIEAVPYSGPHKLMNVGSGVGRSVDQLIADVKATIAGTELPDTVYHSGRPSDVPANVLDISLIERETGWRPVVDWQQGLRDTIAWMRTAEAAQKSGRSISRCR